MPCQLGHSFIFPHESVQITVASVKQNKTILLCTDDRAEVAYLKVNRVFSSKHTFLSSDGAEGNRAPQMAFLLCQLSPKEAPPKGKMRWQEGEKQLPFFYL
jgi:hypothetical protein